VRVKAAVNLQANAFVPGWYIEDMALRLSIYRSISRATDPDALREVEEDVADRFGKPPVEFMNLLMIKSIALEAERAMVSEVSVSGGALKLTFAEGHDISAGEIMAAVPGKLRFHPGGFEVRVKTTPLDTAKRVLRELGAELSPKV